MDKETLKKMSDLEIVMLRHQMKKQTPDDKDAIQAVEDELRRRARGIVE